METTRVKDLMVPLHEYATVYEDATLYEAVMALEEAQKKFDEGMYKHRAVLVYNEGKKIVGKVSQLDVLRALEPKYEQMGAQSGITRLGFGPKFLKSLREEFRLLQEPLAEVCQRANRQKVKKFMYTPTEGEYIDETASLGEAIHQLVIGYHQSLLVTKDEDIVGVLRLTDVFSAVFQIMKASGCEQTASQ